MNGAARPATNAEPAASALERLGDARARLVDALRTLEDVPGTDERGRNGTWALKDVYAHVARWDEHATELLEAQRRRETTPGVDYRLRNATWIAEDEERSLHGARELFEASYREFRNALAAVDGSGWSAAAQELVDSTIEHYEDHIKAPLEFEVAPGG